LSDDQILAERIVEGDSNALTMLIEENWRKVFNFCWRMLGNREDAEEAVQQTFIAVIRNIKKFRGECSLKTWLFSIALNECRMSKRRRIADVSIAVLEDAIAEDGNPEDEASGREHSAMLRTALTQLPLKQRAVITLRINEELTFREIADALGCSENSAKVNFQHGINRLKKEIGYGGYEK
jgi:RNA polymerase sigma-70 factor (ECF subfamily)